MSDSAAIGYHENHQKINQFPGRFDPKIFFNWYETDKT